MPNIKTNLKFVSEFVFIYNVVAERFCGISCEKRFNILRYFIVEFAVGKTFYDERNYAVYVACRFCKLVFR